MKRSLAILAALTASAVLVSGCASSEPAAVNTPTPTVTPSVDPTAPGAQPPATDTGEDPIEEVPAAGILTKPASGDPVALVIPEQVPSIAEFDPTKTTAPAAPVLVEVPLGGYVMYPATTVEEGNRTVVHPLIDGAGPLLVEKMPEHALTGEDRLGAMFSGETADPCNLTRTEITGKPGTGEAWMPLEHVLLHADPANVEVGDEFRILAGGVFCPQQTWVIRVVEEGAPANPQMPTTYLSGAPLEALQALGEKWASRSN